MLGKSRISLLTRRRPKPDTATPERGQVRSGEATIEYEIRRSNRRRKTVEIRLDGDRIVVATPARTPPEEIAAFVLKRVAWIERHRANARTAAAPRRFVTGETVPYLGRDIRLIVEPLIVEPLIVEPSHGPHATVRLLHGTFEVQVPHALPAEQRHDRIVEAFQRWYRTRAEDRIPASVDRWSALTGSHPTRVLIRNQRRRWGSCGVDGTLRFNWRLVLAAPPLLDYVVVHELAHLAVRNHSPNFWAQVAQVMPDHLERRAALRAIGPTLTL